MDVDGTRFAFRDDDNRRRRRRRYRCSRRKISRVRVGSSRLAGRTGLLFTRQPYARWTARSGSAFTLLSYANRHALRMAFSRYARYGYAYARASVSKLPDIHAPRTIIPFRPDRRICVPVEYAILRRLSRALTRVSSYHREDAPLFSRLPRHEEGST